MKKEDLIKKWLNNDLLPQELEALQAMEDYDALEKLSMYSKRFKAPEFNEEKVYQHVTKIIDNKQLFKTSWLQPLSKIAALLAICFGIYFYTTTLNTTISTSLAEKTELQLPDNSIVNLNAGSSLSYSNNKWENSRELNLQGEAFFKVTKGSTFKVITNSGVVTVLGTHFNVKQRADFYEVVCYEGLVEVKINQQSTTLKPGHSIRFTNKAITTKTSSQNDQPAWITNKSKFKSVPLKYVLNEFERQYGVTVEATSINVDTLFTGTFTHTNMSTALKSITQPLKLTFLNSKNRIILTRE